MPSFDAVSKVDQHELSNAVDQTNREVSNRFDLKGTNARVEQSGYELSVHAPSEFQVQQVLDILRNRIAKRGIDVAALECGKLVVGGSEAHQPVTVRHGIDTETARRIVKLVKESKLKVQAVIQEDQVRVSGKKRDDLQTVIVMLRQAALDLPLQYINFRE